MTMISSIEFDDLRTNACQKLEGMSEIIHAVDLTPDKRCTMFNEHASGLMELLHAAMTLTGIASRKAEGLDDVAQTWKSLVDLCDTVLKVVSTLHAENPECVSDFYYDKALDYRNAANSRFLIHC